jgi:uncharacterized protein YecE (DUF72 family)
MMGAPPGAVRVPAYRVGCMGWGYDDWVGPFYPDGTPPAEYLGRYARVFDLTEVDSSFYRPPSPFLTRRWAQQTPSGFTFALKIPQDVTHRPKEPFAADLLRTFVTNLEPIRAAGKLGPLVAQFPPSFRREGGATRLEEILATIPPAYRVAVEFRHASWWAEETWSILESHRAALIWSVYPTVRPPYRMTGDFVYARFVGDRALNEFNRVQRDGRPAVEEMKRHFEDEGRSARDVFVLLNNHFMGFGPGTAELVQEVLGVPKADLARASREPGQQDLSRFA